jgi:hypothetical protein
VGNTGNFWANFGALDLPLNMWDEVDALDTLGDLELPNYGGWLFSVDAASMGRSNIDTPDPNNPLLSLSAVWNVHNNKYTPEGGPRDQAGSIFQAPLQPVGVNQWAIDGVELGLNWPGPPGCDNLNAYDFNPTPNGQLYFSLAKGSPFLDGPDHLPGTADDFSGADMFFYNVLLGQGSLLRAPAANFGLLPGDDIDAFVRLDPVFWPHAWCFSLAPGSPTLANFNNPAGSPADTFWYDDFTHILSRGATAADLGLNIYDNVDALDTGCLMGGGPGAFVYYGEGPSTVASLFSPLSAAERDWVHHYALGSTIPEPVSGMLLLVAGMWLSVRTRKARLRSRK